MTLGLVSLYSVNELIGTLNIRLAQNNSHHFYFFGIHYITSETKNENSIPLADIKTSRDNKKFTTSVYCRPAFSRVFTKFGSLIPESCKHKLLFTSLHKAFKLCSNFELLHQEIDKLRTVFENNDGYP